MVTAERLISTTEYTSFDILGRVTGHKQTTSGGASGGYTTSYAYNLSGALIEQTYPSGRQITQIGLGHSATNTGFLKINYEYGDWDGSTLDTEKNNGNLARQTITVPTIANVTGFTAVQTYTYDSLDRLKSSTEKIGETQSWKQTFNYDRFGNRRFEKERCLACKIAIF